MASSIILNGITEGKVGMKDNLGWKTGKCQLSLFRKNIYIFTM